jgi:hypothetical protein
MLLNVLKHPVAAHIVLVATSYTKEPTVVTHHSPAELGDVVLEVNKVLRLLVSGHIVKMDVLVAPLEVMYYSFVSQLLFHDENILEEINDPFFDVEMVKLSDHRFLIFQIPLVLVDQRISFINYVPDIVKDSAVSAHIKLG